MMENASKSKGHDKSSIDKSQSYWTNRSVVKFARDEDPIQKIAQAARDVVLDAIEKGWYGPPYSPFQLASYRGLIALPNNDVQDARLIPSSPEGASIEFNPNYPPARVRFSVAHELAHTLFPDYTEAIRMRGRPKGDEWQLELLCNIAAAEFLMPIGASGELENEPIDIENLIYLRKKYDVSTEALFLRIIKLTKKSCALFSAARVSDEDQSPVFRIDYIVPSRSWRIPISRALKINRSTVLSDCTAVGFTSKGRERWNDILPEFNIECVGIPAYPGDIFPRILGIIHQIDGSYHKSPEITEVRGDATKPRGTGQKVIAHIVNDRTPVWGAGFGRVIGTKWPSAQNDFKEWVRKRRANLALGNTHASRVSQDLDIFQMVAQQGYGRSIKPRIRYVALRKCLDQLAEYALREHASVHMPLIGTGYAGGKWSIIREMIYDSLISRGVEVTVYSLPDYRYKKDAQSLLSSSASYGGSF